MNEDDNDIPVTTLADTEPQLSPVITPTEQFYKMLPRDEGVTPSPVPTPVPEKQKFSSKLKGLFSKNKKEKKSIEENKEPTHDEMSSPVEKFESPDIEDNSEEPSPVLRQVSSQSNHELVIEEAEAPDYAPPAEPINETIDDINKEINYEEPRITSPYKAALIAADVPDMDIPEIDSPEDDEKDPQFNQQEDADDDFQTRNVNESKADFYEQNMYQDQPIQHKVDEYDRRSSLSPSEIERKSLKKEKCLNFVKFSFKQTVLIGLVVAYAFVGSLLFQLLEQYNEMKGCQESHGADIANIVLTKAKLIEYVQFNVTSNSLDTTRDNETYAVTRIEEMLTEYRDEVLNIGYSGCETKWNIINGFLFCLTVVTTIGYGQVFPTTWQGQIVCICYAIFGIPLFLACLANISTVLSFLFRWMYVKVCCGICNYRKKQKAKKESENQQNDGERSPSQNSNGQNENADYNGSQARIVDDNEDLENEMNDSDDIENVSVPLTITILVVTAYILIGAVIFAFFEDWKIIESAYFCFVTLTTIGFGDLVPGQNFSDPLVAYKLAAGCVYILLGLAILGMAFDLMQEELISKFTWFGKKIGLLDAEDEDDDDDKKTAKSVNDMNEIDEKKQNDYGSNEKVMTEKENY